MPIAALAWAAVAVMMMGIIGCRFHYTADVAWGLLLGCVVYQLVGADLEYESPPAHKKAE